MSLTISSRNIIFIICLYSGCCWKPQSANCTMLSVCEVLQSSPFFNEGWVSLSSSKSICEKPQLPVHLCTVPTQEDNVPVHKWLYLEVVFIKITYWKLFCLLHIKVNTRWRWEFVIGHSVSGENVLNGTFQRANYCVRGDAWCKLQPGWRAGCLPLCCGVHGRGFCVGAEVTRQCLLRCFEILQCWEVMPRRVWEAGTSSLWSNIDS